MKLIKEKILNLGKPLKWHKYVTVRLAGDDSGEFYTAVEVSPLTREQYIKDHDYWDIVSCIEIDGKPKKDECKCAECGKSFVIGDRIIKMDFTEKTIVFLDKHLAYFAEVHEGDDSLDTHDQCRYLTHASHVKPETIAEFKRGRRLWEEGMGICRRIKEKTFKGWK